MDRLNSFDAAREILRDFAESERSGPFIPPDRKHPVVQYSAPNNHDTAPMYLAFAAMALVANGNLSITGSADTLQLRFSPALSDDFPLMRAELALRHIQTGLRIFEPQGDLTFLNGLACLPDSMDRQVLLKSMLQRYGQDLGPEWKAGIQVHDDGRLSLDGNGLVALLHEAGEPVRGRSGGN